MRKQRHNQLCSLPAQLISAFVFTTGIVQFLFFLNSKFQASSLFLRLYRPVCVGPSQKPRRPVFSRHGSYLRISKICLLNRCSHLATATPHTVHFYKLISFFTVQPQYNTPHYNAVFNLTWPCHDSQTNYFAICLKVFPL